MRGWIVSLSVLSLGVCALAQQAITLKRAPKVGEIAKYRVTMIFTLQGTDITYKSLITDQVDLVDKDGSYTVESTQAEISGTHGERDLNVDQHPLKSITVYNASGAVIDLKGEQSPESWRIANASAFYLPNGAIPASGTYTVQVPASTDKTRPSATVTYTSAGTEKIGDIDALVLKESYKENVTANGMTSDGKVWVDPATAVVLKMDVDWKNAPLLGTSSFVNGHVSYAKE